MPDRVWTAIPDHPWEDSADGAAGIASDGRRPGASSKGRRLMWRNEREARGRRPVEPIRVYGVFMPTRHRCKISAAAQLCDPMKTSNRGVISAWRWDAQHATGCGKT